MRPYPRSAAEDDSEAFRLKQQKKKEKNRLLTFVGKASAFPKVCLEEESRAADPIQEDDFIII